MHLHDQSDEEIFQHHRKKLLLMREWTRRLWVWRMKINVNACTLENFSHLFSLVSGKFQTGKFPPVKLPPGKFPLAIFPHVFLNIPARVFKFFLHYCYRYHWYYLKDCFVIVCSKSAEVFMFVKICQNEVLSEERQLMKWVVIIQVRIFWVPIFRGKVF